MRIAPVEHQAQLEALANDTLECIDQLIENIREIRERAALLSRELDEDRGAVQSEREERELLASLDYDEDERPAPDSETKRLESSETRLVAQLREARSFERSLADFASVLLSAHRQIETGSDLPDPESANYLAIKMAELRAREEERQRFARDVHDGPAQAFANAIIGLEFIERALKTERDNVIEDSLAEIERIKRTMREGLTEIRRFIFDNRPTMLRDRGLGPTLSHYVQSYQSIFPMVVLIEIDDSLVRLEPDLELAAFRMVQESIQNASKHARATRVDVAIRQPDDDHVVVTVADDGRGFDPKRVSAHAMGGVGLKGMEERIRLVGGHLEILSERGAGTCVKLTLPARTGGGDSEQC